MSSSPSVSNSWPNGLAWRSRAFRSYSAFIVRGLTILSEETNEVLKRAGLISLQKLEDDVGLIGAPNEYPIKPEILSTNGRIQV